MVMQRKVIWLLAQTAHTIVERELRLATLATDNWEATLPRRKEVGEAWLAEAIERHNRTVQAQLPGANEDGVSDGVCYL